MHLNIFTVLMNIKRTEPKCIIMKTSFAKTDISILNLYEMCYCAWQMKPKLNLNQFDEEWLHYSKMDLAI